jgi:YidC/Oxa1 family membrane protein insertase
MDRNTITGLLIIFAIFIGWSIWMTPSKDELETKKRRQDSLLLEQRKRDSVSMELARRHDEKPAEIVINPVEVANPQVRDSLIQKLNDKWGMFSGSAIGDKQFYTLENDLVKIRLSNKGGRPYSVELKNYKTFDTLPLMIFDSLESKFALEFFARPRRTINTQELFFRPSPANLSTGGITVAGDSTQTFALRLYADAGDSTGLSDSYIEYLYTLTGNDYMMGFSIRLVNMDKVFEPTTTFINLSWGADLHRQEKNLENEQNESTVYYCYATDKEVDYLSETKDDRNILKTSLKWISFKSKFFVSTLVARESFGAGAEVSTFRKPQRAQDARYLESMSAVIPIEYRFADFQEYPFQLYYGPNKYKTLRAYKMKLERQIPLGWSFVLMWPINVYAVIPVFDWLSTYGLNYGIIILILTILLKIFLFPIAYISYRSTAKMRAMKPDIEELGKKFPKKEDAMKKQQATMELYRKAGVNPMAGCIPMLLQFPILIALFRFFPTSIELRQQPFLWAHDLSSYDSILSLPFTIPFYGDHVSLFTLLMTISTLIYTKMNNDLMSTGSQQLPGMKTMMYIMPIMFLGMFNNFSSGLSYYYFLANMFTFGQMFIIRRTIDEKKLHAQIQANRNKPVKKSNFQKRLEEMAKQRGAKR